MQIPLDSRVSVPDCVLARDLGNEMVILHLDRKEFLGLDDVGARMWHALSESETIRDALDQLHSLYEVDRDVLKDDLLGLVGQMLEVQLVRLEAPTE